MKKRTLPKKLLRELIEIRRDLHRNPELAFEERRTSEVVAAFLEHLAIDVRKGVGGTGVVALVEGKGRGRVVALRADMDALPMREETGLPYASRNENMHACGHDGHVAVLLGAAATLVREREKLKGSIKFIFQPAEEHGMGAAAMIRDGVIKKPKIDAIFGLHCWPAFGSGQIGLRNGTMAASADPFTITIVGKGCHAGYPHTGIDPIFVSAKVIDNLQGLISRERKPTDPAVISIGMIHGGTAPNRIPDRVTLRGTIRTLSEDARRDVLAGMRRVIRLTARTFGARSRFALGPGGTGPVVNDPVMVDLVREAGADLLGKRNVVEIDRPTMGGEDFSEYLQHVPGCFFRLGVRRKDEKDPAWIHQSNFDFNDDAIEPGVLILCEVARRFLAGA